MRQTNIHQGTLARLLLLLAIVVPGASAQVPKPDWRRIGNAAFDYALAGVATGPVGRVWYSDDGSTVYVRNLAGRTFSTGDFESWTPVAAPAVPPAAEDLTPGVRPEAPLRIRGARTVRTRLYGFGKFIYKSEDGGRSWANLTSYKGASLIGDGVLDLAVSPRDAEEVMVAAQSGVWRSSDGGLSWSSVNQSLPNLPVRRLLGFPSDTRGVRIAIDRGGAALALEWSPGEKHAWRAFADEALARDEDLKRTFSAALGVRITVVAASGDYAYAGAADGQLFASSDKGRNWRKNPDAVAAPVEQIVIDSRDPRLALAALGSRFPDQPVTARAPHVIRILNAGALFDDLTANLPDVPVHGIAADRATGAVYAATDRGLFLAFEDLLSAAPPAQWVALSDGLPDGAVQDVKLDAAGNQLYAAVEGFGVYATPAPHRFRDPRIVSAADLTARPAAPGSLLSVLGANVRSANVGDMSLPVFPGSDLRSEIQVPFEARGTSLALALQSAGGAITVGVPLQIASPAILVDQEGAPVVLDADSGVMLDAMTPARSNARLQILATGMGRVRPDFPTGMRAPAENPPQVIAGVRAYLDRLPVEVTRATLAPGYVGFYLIEVELPKLVNYGPAELYIEAEGQASNRVRVYIEP